MDDDNSDTEITGDPNETELGPGDPDTTFPDEFPKTDPDTEPLTWGGDTGAYSPGSCHPKDGAKLVVAMVDYNDTDAAGRPKTIQSQYEFTTLDLAKMDERDFADHVLELASRQVLAEFRSDETDTDND